jgi:hypothetical protein
VPMATKKRPLRQLTWTRWPQVFARSLLTLEVLPISLKYDTSSRN